MTKKRTLREARIATIVSDMRSIARELTRNADDIEGEGLSEAVDRLLLGYAHRLSQNAVAAARIMGE
jgi:hypothetical protein